MSLFDQVKLLYDSQLYEDVKILVSQRQTPRAQESGCHQVMMPDASLSHTQSPTVSLTVSLSQ